MRSHTSVEAYYNALAPHYHLAYENWEAAMRMQGEALDKLISVSGRYQLQTVLDVACGIGTQSLALAALGYSVTASDVSRLSIERARLEAEGRRLAIKFSIADMRSAYRHHRKTFDVVLCGDNAIPHLLSDDEIVAACREFYACTNPGGVCVISLRDYDKDERTGVQLRPQGVRREKGQKTMIFQVWEWRESLYDAGLYFLSDDGTDLQADVVRSTYYAISIEQIMSLMRRAGFQNVVRRDDVLVYPVVIGEKPFASSLVAGGTQVP